MINKRKITSLSLSYQHIVVICYLLFVVIITVLLQQITSHDEDSLSNLLLFLHSYSFVIFM